MKSTRPRRHVLPTAFRVVMPWKGLVLGVTRSGYIVRGYHVNPDRGWWREAGRDAVFSTRAVAVRWARRHC